MTYPVLFHGTEIGNASTERGALNVVSRHGISKLACERFTATLAERPDGSKAWFTGLQLIGKGR